MMTNQEIVYCAGGLVWKEGTSDREVLLILSRNDQAWKLPKGHIESGDPSWEAAAQREVLEETGCRTVIIDFAGFTRYPVGKRPKVVLYWHMAPIGNHVFEPNDEVEAIAWLPVREAVDRLTFLNDKKFLLDVTAPRSRIVQSDQ